MTTLAEVLGKNSYLTLLPSNKIKCSVTNHEMSPDLKVVLAHINGKKFKKSLEWYNKDYSQYEPYIVQHKTDKQKLFCNVTKTALNKIPQQIEKHFNGKRFQKLKELYDEEKKKAAKKGPNKKIAKADDESEEEDFWMPEEEDEEADGEMIDEEDEEEHGGEDEEDDEEEEEEEEEEEPVKVVGKASKKRKLDEDSELVVFRKKLVGKKGAKRVLDKL